MVQGWRQEDQLRGVSEHDEGCLREQEGTHTPSKQPVFSFETTRKGKSIGDLATKDATTQAHGFVRALEQRVDKSTGVSI